MNEEITQEDLKDRFEKMTHSRKSIWNDEALKTYLLGRIEEENHIYIDVSLTDIYRMCRNGDDNIKHREYFGRLHLRKVLKQLETEKEINTILKVSKEECLIKVNE